MANGNSELLTEQAIGDFLKQIYYQGKDDLGYSDTELARDIKVIQSQKQAHADMVIGEKIPDTGVDDYTSDVWNGLIDQQRARNR